MDLVNAKKSADLIIAELTPYCLVHERGQPYCKIAGSVRRQKPGFIKDIEIVSVPDTRHLFVLRDLVNKKWGTPSMGLFPSKYTKVRGAYDIDFFWPSLQTFGLIFFIRTGPQEFVTKALSWWKKKTQGGYSEEGQLRTKDGTTIPTPTELSVFEALGWRWVEPKDRL